jgi:thiamine biosynthesis protein ThiS
MNITLNNRLETFDAQTLSVAEILKVKKFSFKMLVIKLNGKFVMDEDRETTFVKDGDLLAIIHLESGG